ncbi:MAG: response regulator [Myxococcales bacterium]|nr:response regulator [Myxococcales bacterium]
MSFILVVEDNPANVALISEVLEDEGHDFVVARNGAEGLAYAFDLMPDMILMDVSLPLISGLDATSILKGEAKTRDIPIMALTAHAMAGDKDECLRAGCDEYETKPITPGRVMNKVKLLIDNRDPAFVEQLERTRRHNGMAVRYGDDDALHDLVEELREELAQARTQLEAKVSEVSSFESHLQEEQRVQQDARHALEAQVAQLSEEKAELQQEVESQFAELQSARDQARKAATLLAKRSSEGSGAPEEALAALKRAHAAELQALADEHGRALARAGSAGGSAGFDALMRRVEELERRDQSSTSNAAVLQAELRRARQTASAAQRALRTLQTSLRSAVDASFNDALNANVEAHVK